MSSASVGSHHSGTGALSLMSCVRESSPLQDYHGGDTDKNVASKKRFWNPKKWFRRKNSKVVEEVVQVDDNEQKDTLRSRSTSELSVEEEHARRRSSSMLPGLSVSHDSIFHSPAHSGSDMDLNTTQSASSLSITQPLGGLQLQTELSERLRARRSRGDISEDDEGLPHSPCNSPTAGDGLLHKTANKDLPTKSQSTCSDGSLLSMGSSEMDEDSYGVHSKTSSKLSLHDKKPIDQDDLELGPGLISTPLNHSAAHHRVAVRPKRTHGAPRRKKMPHQLSTALPVTPEVNEDSSVRSMTPEYTIRENVTNYIQSESKHLTMESQVKCSSLPIGISPPTESSKVNRSKSNVGSDSKEPCPTVEEEHEESNKASTFYRLFTRKSAKKKKKKEEKQSHKIEENIVSIDTVDQHSIVQSVSSSKSYESSSMTQSQVVKHSMESKPIPVPKYGPGARQRIQPKDLPPSPDAKRNVDNILPPQSPQKSSMMSLSNELENLIRQRQMSPTNAILLGDFSPPKSMPPSTESVHFSTSPKSVISKPEQTHFVKSTKNVEIKREFKHEENKSKVKIAGLSSLQQRVLSHREDSNDSDFKSLTDFTSESNKVKAVTKSHSFKSYKSPLLDERLKSRQTFIDSSSTNKFVTTGNFEKKEISSIMKASSLDSVKTLDSPTMENVKLCDKETKEFNDSIPTVTKKPDLSNDDDVMYKLKVVKSDDNTNNIDEFDDITISGPSHTNNDINTPSTFAEPNTEAQSTEISEKLVEKNVTTSITKIQLKRESTQVTQSTVTIPQSEVPEFVKKQLNRVESRPKSNIIFSMNSPRVIDERPKTIFNLDLDADTTKQTTRKFSKDNLEIIDKNENEIKDITTTETVTSSVSQHQSRFIKNTTRKTSTVILTPDSPKSEKPPQSRSVSLESLKADSKDSDKSSSQNSLDSPSAEKSEDLGSFEKSASVVQESVILRRKVSSHKKNDEEPELMKVFARRSLKIKDTDAELIASQLNDSKLKQSNESNKENQEDVKSNNISKEEEDSEVQLRKDINNKPKIIDSIESLPKLDQNSKEPLVESSKNLLRSSTVDETKSYTSEVSLQKNGKKRNITYQRCVSLNPPKNNEPDLLKKQSTFTDHRKTEILLSDIKNEDSAKEIISDITTTKQEFIEKNFNQRKAEWERRAQEAQKKSVP